MLEFRLSALVRSSVVARCTSIARMQLLDIREGGIDSAESGMIWELRRSEFMPSIPLAGNDGDAAGSRIETELETELETTSDSAGRQAPRWAKRMPRGRRFMKWHDL